MKDDEISGAVIGAAIKVHRALGPGLLESAYRECLAFEIIRAGLRVEQEKPVPIVYETVKLDHGYRLDLLIENKVVVELKTVEALTDVHTAQVLTYLRLGGYPLGLLINFHVAMLKDGIRRFVNYPR